MEANLSRNFDQKEFDYIALLEGKDELRLSMF